MSTSTTLKLALELAANRTYAHSLTNCRRNGAAAGHR